MATRTKAPTNIMRRGEAWVVHLRVNGSKHWETFPDREYGSREAALDAAELRAAQLRAQRRAGTYAPAVRATFREAAEAWYEHGVGEGGKRGPWKATTRRDHRSLLDVHLLPAFGELMLGDVTAARIGGWRRERMAAGRLGWRTAGKTLAALHGIYEYARRHYGHPRNPAADVQRLGTPEARPIDFYSPEEVWALVRAATAPDPDRKDTPRARAAREQDAAIILTAAFTGLRRGELVALRVRSVDFAGSAIRVEGSFSGGELSTPKSGRARTVPMVPEVATALSRLLDARGEPAADELVFPGDDGYLDGSALRRRYQNAQRRAGLRPLRFHDLRHTFGSLAIARASIVQVQSWLGHADIKTTMRYLHHKPLGDEAALLAGAFRPAPVAGVLQAEGFAAVPEAA